MTKYYDVRFNGREVGSLHLAREGAFYRYDAQCQLPKEHAYRLLLITGEKSVPLRLFVPKEELSVCVGRISVNSLCCDDISFQVIHADQKALEATPDPKKPQAHP